MMAAKSAAPLADMLALGGMFMLLTFLIFAFYGLFAAAMRDRVLAQASIMARLRRGFAAAFVALAAKLAVQDRLLRGERPVL